MMKYKNYIGQVEFDDEAGLFHGEVVGTRDVITFQGESVKELQQAFHDSVDDYLAFCAARGESPDKPFSGQFLTRITPELHREINQAAALAGQSLNAWVTEHLEAIIKDKSSQRVPKETTRHQKRSGQLKKPKSKRSKHATNQS